MKLVKAMKKQLQLADAGNLYICVNCHYLRVDKESCLAMQGVEFYTDERVKTPSEPVVTVKQSELKRLYKKINILNALK